MIRFSQVWKRYPNGFEALKNISFELPQGSFTFLTGHSGAGKSTLLKLITLAEVASRGQVQVEGRNLARLRGNGVAHYRRTIGSVFQDHKLLHDRTVLMITHDPLEALRLSDRILVLRGSPAKLSVPITPTGQAPRQVSDSQVLRLQGELLEMLAGEAS